jgi:hypothetical protein
MATNQSSSAEHVLLARVERALRAAGVAGVGDAILLEPAPRLEDRALARGGGGSGRMRIPAPTRSIASSPAASSAFAAALEAGTRNAGLAATIDGPRVVVARSRRRARSGGVAFRGPSLGTQWIGDLERNGRGVVLADDLSAATSIATATSRSGDALGLHFKTGEDDRILRSANRTSTRCTSSSSRPPSRSEQALERAAHHRAPMSPSQPAPPPPGALPRRRWARSMPSWVPSSTGSTTSRRIGHGGFGVVYEARDPHDHRIAIKLMRPDATRPAADLEAFKSRRAARPPLAPEHRRPEDLRAERGRELVLRHGAPRGRELV